MLGENMEHLIKADGECHKDRIIAGRFATKADADAVAQQILRYVDDDDLSIFHNNPPGQHGKSVFGDDEEIKRKTECLPSLEISGYIDPIESAVAQKENTENAARAEKIGVETTAATAAVAGLFVGAAALAAGPVVALAAAGVAAYTGSLAGALEGMGGGTDSRSTHVPTERLGGIILALHIANPANESRVIQDLENAGATDIEWADGEWLDGDWADFNPNAAPNLLTRFHK